MREACGIACRAGDMNTFCCDGFKVGDEDVFCADSRLEVDCSVNCEGFECSRGGNFIEIILGVGPNKVNCQTLVPTQCLVVSVIDSVRNSDKYVPSMNQHMVLNID